MTHRQLESIVDQLRAAQDRVHDLARRTPNGRWATRADPARWSVSECVAHLNLTSRAFIPLLRRAFDDPRYAGVPAPAVYRRDFFGWLLSFAVGPTPRIAGRRIGRFRTAAGFVPTAQAARDALVAEFDELQHQLIDLAREAEGKPLGRMRVVSPFDARASYNAYSALVVIPRHQHRHLDQAEDVWRDADPSDQHSPSPTPTP